jgi:uncharacterized alpha/beta hydrolase family protein
MATQEMKSLWPDDLIKQLMHEYRIEERSSAMEKILYGTSTCTTGGEYIKYSENPTVEVIKEEKKKDELLFDPKELVFDGINKKKLS